MLSRFTSSMPFGLVEGEPEEAYHASGCLGSTLLNRYLESPEGFQRGVIGRDPRWTKDFTDEMRAGKLVHACVERRGALDGHVIIAPDEHTTDKGALSKSKKALAWAKEQDPAKILATQEEYDTGRFLYDRLQSQPLVRQMLEGCKSEVTMRVLDPQTQLPVQIRVDVLQPWCRADIKTTGKPLKSFKWSVRDYGMDTQAALYDLVDQAVTKIDREHFWIVAQTAYPYEVKVWQASEALLAIGAEKVDRALNGIAAQDWGTPQTEPEMMEATT